MGAHGPYRCAPLRPVLTHEGGSAAGHDRPGAFHGRRKGKRLRAAQAELLEMLLPRLRIERASLQGQPHRSTGLSALFPGAPDRVRLEIGFGGGEHLLAQARAHPDIGFIGCEPFVNGIAKLLSAVDRERIANIRVWDADATALLPHLPPESIDRAYLPYPDPWPKRRHRKRRFISDETLVALARVLRPGAELRFATDIDDYAGWALARVLRRRDLRWTAERADDWRQPWPGWLQTRYEAKALREGRKPIYLRFERGW
jgi:tRNA (guanine-N7-)-methyltransferase